MTTLAYARSSPGSAPPENQIEVIQEAYPELVPENIYFDRDESGDNRRRRQYLEFKRRLDEDGVDCIVSTKLDRLGRSAAEVAELVDLCADEGIRIHLLTQGIDADPDDKMGQMMVKILGLVAEMELQFNRERREAGIKRAMENGVQFGPAPYGMKKNDMGVPIPKEDGSYEATQEFIREVRKGRAQKPTAEFFGIPVGSISNILDSSEDRYGVAFTREDWRIERAKVKNGDKQLETLGDEE